MGGQFEPKLVVNLHRNWVVNLTVFSNNITKGIAFFKTMLKVKN